MGSSFAATASAKTRRWKKGLNATPAKVLKVYEQSSDHNAMKELKKIRKFQIYVASEFEFLWQLAKKKRREEKKRQKPHLLNQMPFYSITRVFRQSIQNTYKNHLRVVILKSRLILSVFQTIYHPLISFGNSRVWLIQRKNQRTE